MGQGGWVGLHVSLSVSQQAAVVVGQGGWVGLHVSQSVSVSRLLLLRDRAAGWASCLLSVCLSVNGGLNFFTFVFSVKNCIFTHFGVL